MLDCPPLFPCGGLKGGVFPDPPGVLESLPAPPPEPPSLPPLPCDAPFPPPLDVIVEKIEFDPQLLEEPPAPTVIV